MKRLKSLMKDLTEIDLFAISLAAFGIVFSASGNLLNDDFLVTLGGFMTGVSVFVAVFGFVTRTRETQSHSQNRNLEDRE